MAGFVNYRDIEFLPIREDADIEKMSKRAKKEAMDYHLKEAARFGSSAVAEIRALKRKVKGFEVELEHRADTSIDLWSKLGEAETLNAKLRKDIRKYEDELDQVKLDLIALKFDTCTCSDSCVCSDICMFCRAKAICEDAEEDWCTERSGVVSV